MMLPGKRKKLIIILIAIVAIVIVVIAMYNLAKFMQSKAEIDEDKTADDAYVSDYLYYGFIYDEDGNYQLMGLDADFNETLLGLRSFYAMNNLYYYDNHLVLYTDAINQINYDAQEKTYFFYEQNPFYSNDSDVWISPDYYIFYNGERLEYCAKSNCERTLISEELADDIILLSNNLIFYELNNGIYMYDLDEGVESLVMIPDQSNNMQLLVANQDYLVFVNGLSIYAYEIDKGLNTNVSEAILVTDPEFSFVTLQDSYIIYQVTDANGDNALKKYSLNIMSNLNTVYNIGKEEVSATMVINDTILYAELADGDNMRYVIMDMEEQKVLKDLDNYYVVMVGV